VIGVLENMFLNVSFIYAFTHSLRSLGGSKKDFLAGRRSLYCTLYIVQQYMYTGCVYIYSIYIHIGDIGVRGFYYKF